MENKIQEKLAEFIGKYNTAETMIEWNKYHRFEDVYKHNTISKMLYDNQGCLEEIFGYIGKDVYKSKSSFYYSLVVDFNNVSFQEFYDSSSKILFTRELFDKFCEDYFRFLVEYLTEKFLGGEIVCDNNSKIHNLVFEWELWCKQKLIKIYKEILNGKS